MTDARQPTSVGELADRLRSAAFGVSRAIRWAEQDRGAGRRTSLVPTMHDRLDSLNAILGWAQMLREHPADTAAVVRVADVIERNGRMLWSWLRGPTDARATPLTSFSRASP